MDEEEKVQILNARWEPQLPEDPAVKKSEIHEELWRIDACLVILQKQHDELEDRLGSVMQIPGQSIKSVNEAEAEAGSELGQRMQELRQRLDSLNFQFSGLLERLVL